MSKNKTNSEILNQLLHGQDLDVETSKRTKVTHTGSDEYPRQPEPFAFGFLVGNQ